MKKWVILLAVMVLAVSVCAIAAADKNINQDLDKAYEEGYWNCGEMDISGNHLALLQNSAGNVKLYVYRQRNNGTWYRWFATREGVPQGTGEAYLASYNSGTFEVGVKNGKAVGEYAEYTHTKAGRWLMTTYVNTYNGTEVEFKGNTLTYIGDDDRVLGKVEGTFQRDLQYCHLRNVPRTVGDARAKLTTAPAIPEGTLSEDQSIQFTGNKRFGVYTGPGENYVRANNNKATVSTNGWIQVFGSEAGWILIDYSIDANHYRFGWIPESSLPANATVKEIEWDPINAVLGRSLNLTDDPLYSQSALVRLNEGTEVTCLGTMGKWAYVEYWNEATQELYRGFVPLADLTVDDGYTEDEEAVG